ncbi:TLC domain-containing protein KNAG_0B05390 [Huiozyma naganishii CBS 8797]|uniref:TLC domain-containing protein n=1 Tax=Huiozyma naganishii (strain ATCC MYA-139 / BCRC 22969 / CBS 8797 / KCTC 17520 / NBRC 10181 / NCYC 3082 / Yp74L-3) TaxID=1071383 RepID=J7RVN3_HUIN7|nr:hypothetical protein KNAG_0B05390 [Kazachstania naganishii CBS 8797]CCK68972.1 hypothetical protein KNAG_0B05390 [Kazachstania naganishii CBS 8797]
MSSTGREVHPNNNLKPMSRQGRRRASSVGKIDLGDTVRSANAIEGAEVDESSYFPHGMTQSPKVFLNNCILSYGKINARHSWITPLVLVTCTYLVYFLSDNQTESNPLHMFVAISYRIGDTDFYGKGIKDIPFVFFYMIFFTFLRDFVMDMIIRPFALRAVSSKHQQNRLMEQIFYIFYYGLSGPFGLYIMYGSDLWLFRTSTMYATYPDLNNPYLFKLFYLGQAAFWTQQACVLVLQLEKPRKDYNELKFHHVVTLLLIWLSYVFHFTKMGLPIYITMDVSDTLLALSKTLNYLDSSLTSPVFVIFMLAWIYLRHYVNLKILWSLLTEFRTVGKYGLNFATQQYKCWISLTITFILISALQLVNLYWLF